MEKTDNENSRQSRRKAERELTKGEGHLKRLLAEAKMIGTLKPGEELVYIPIPAGHKPELIITSVAVGNERTISTKGLGKNNFGAMMNLLNAAMTTVTQRVWEQFVDATKQLTGDVIQHAKLRQRHLDLDKKFRTDSLSEDEKREYELVLNQIRELDNLPVAKKDEDDNQVTVENPAIEPPKELTPEEMVAQGIRVVGTDKDGNQMLVAADLNELTPDVIRTLLAKENQGCTLDSAFIIEANEFLGTSGDDKQDSKE